MGNQEAEGSLPNELPIPCSVLDWTQLSRPEPIHCRRTALPHPLECVQRPVLEGGPSVPHLPLLRNNTPREGEQPNTPALWTPEVSQH